MTTLADRLTADRVRMDVKFVDTTKDADGWEHHLYRVTLRRKRRQWTLDFRQGIGHTADPRLLDVMCCILADTSGYANASGFLDWAETYDYNQDSIKARKLYQAVKRQSDRLERFLGGYPTYHKYVNETDWSDL